MKQRSKNMKLDFEIDDLTNAIRNLISGDCFSTELMRLTKNDFTKITKKNK